jgi:cytochrome P450
MFGAAMDLNTWLVIGAIVLSTYLLLRWSYCRSDRNTVLGYPIIGLALTNLLSAEKLAYTVLDLAKKYGPIFDTFAFSLRFTVVTEAEDIQEILMKRPHVFSRPVTHAAEAIKISGILGASADKWRVLRRVTAPPFSKKNIEKFAAQVWKECESRVKHIPPPSM